MLFIVIGMALFLLILKPFQLLNWSLNGCCSSLFRVLTPTGGEHDQNKALNLSFRSRLPKHFKIKCKRGLAEPSDASRCLRWKMAFSEARADILKGSWQDCDAAAVGMMRNMPLGSRAEHLKETVRQLRCDLQRMMLRKKSFKSVLETDGVRLEVCQKKSTHKSSRGVREAEEEEDCGELNDERSRTAEEPSHRSPHLCCFSSHEDPKGWKFNNTTTGSC